MFVQQFFVKGLAHSSYLLGGSKICAIVDPRRDVDIYLQAAKEMGLKITHVLETHLHADFDFLLVAAACRKGVGEKFSIFADGGGGYGDGTIGT